MVGTIPNQEGRVRPNAAQKRIIDRWLQLGDDCSESDLEAHFVVPIFESLGIRHPQLSTKGNIALDGQSRLRPDVLIYADVDQPPILVVENKARCPNLAKILDEGFLTACQQHAFYRQAIGYIPNGIKQYLDVDRVKPEFLASYGLVFNGDFFQLWRRVDGLVFPLTAIQRVTRASIPGLMRQLEYCLSNPQNGLVATAWNRKGGVAKTTNTLNMGATLALAGKKVLLVDLDAQGDLTRGLGLEPTRFPNYLKSCADKFELREFDAMKDVLDAAIQQKSFPTSDNRSFNLSVLSTAREFLEASRDRSQGKSFADKTTSVPFEPMFKQIIHCLRRDYDYILIDASPSFDPLTRAVLYACDTVLIPSNLSGKSLHHAIDVHQTVIPKMRELRAKREHLHLAPWSLGIAFSNCPGNADNFIEKTIQPELQKRGFVGKQYKERLQTYAQIASAEFKHMPVICWQNSPITKLYANLVNEIFLSHNFTDH